MINARAPGKKTGVHLALRVIFEFIATATEVGYFKKFVYVSIGLSQVTAEVYCFTDHFFHDFFERLVAYV